MILSALNDYYARVRREAPDQAPPPYGFSREKIVAAVELSADGDFRRLIDYRLKDGKRLLPRALPVPGLPKRTVQIAPGFLCDTATYFFGIDRRPEDQRRKKPNRPKEQFAASRHLHEDLTADLDHPVATAVRRHFETWTPGDTERLAAEDDSLLDGFLVFLVQDSTGLLRHAHEVEDLRAVWLRHLAEADAVTGQCLTSGAHNVPIARIHPSIKGVPGGQTTGMALVSFNLDAFTSYGKTQNLNAPIGEEAAFGYTTALNHLLRPESRQKLRIGETMAVVWAERQTEAEDLFGAFLNPSLGEDGQDDAGEAARLRGELERLSHGQPVADPTLKDAADITFHVLGLAPNAARASIRFWLTDRFGGFLEHLSQHLQDVRLGGTNRLPPGLWRLVLETLPKDRDGKTRRSESQGRGLEKLYGDLLRAVLGGTPYPLSLLPLMLARLRADRHVTAPRVGLIKGVLTRTRRLHHQEDLPVALDPDRPETAYQLGRLFAALEKLQEDALGTVNAGIRDKFLASVSATPRAAFPYLLKLAQAHRKKARRDNARSVTRFERVAADVHDRITSYPASLSPEDQGLFFIGYYQQRTEFFRKRSKEDGDSPEAPDADDHAAEE